MQDRSVQEGGGDTAAVLTPQPPAVDAWIDELGLGGEPGFEIPWERLRNRPLTLREQGVVREFYAARYQNKNDYRARKPWHSAIFDFRHLVARTVFRGLGKTLDAGCASGEGVSHFRAAGTDCWGFDICPDLLDVVYPEAKPYVRMGRFDAIPFSAADGFETLVSYDVVEHVPIDLLEALPDELLRLGIRKIACIISNDTISEGHITIQDLSYYEELLGRAGFRLRRDVTAHLADIPVPAGYDQAAGEIVWRRYDQTGNPTNRWNDVPGYLFFQR